MLYISYFKHFFFYNPSYVGKQIMNSIEWLELFKKLDYKI